METPRNKSDAEILRQKAEGVVNAAASRSVPLEPGMPVSENELRKLIRELAFQNEEKAKRAEELVFVNTVQ
jgi:hypothetical protein